MFAHESVRVCVRECVYAHVLLVVLGVCFHCVYGGREVGHEDI